MVRQHRIEYLLPAFADAGDEIRRWVENVRTSLLRKYEFVRRSDGKTLVRGETDWVFVNIQTGRPQIIPLEVSRLLGLI